ITQLQSAMETVMENHLKEIDIIANNDEAPTFENTLLAMERASIEPFRIYSFYNIWSSNLSTPEFRDIQTILSPKLSEYQSKITQNEKLFQRIKTVYENSKENP